MLPTRAIGVLNCDVSAARGNERYINRR